MLTEQSERLLALLGLSLEGPDLPSAEWLSRLGAFHGGALESALTAICEFDEERWWSLRQELERIGLIMVERLSGVVDPFLRFHPTLVTAVQAKPSVGDHRQLTRRHLAVYYGLFSELSDLDAKEAAAARASARRELPNLLAALRGALHAGEPWAVDFADKMHEGLELLDLRQDQAVLDEDVRAVAGEVGSDSWYLVQSARGDVLYTRSPSRSREDSCRHPRACRDHPSPRRCATLDRLGRCYRAKQQTARAEAICRQALTEADQLEQTEAVRQEIGYLQADLGDGLMAFGRYQDARVAHEKSLAIARVLGNDRSCAVSLGQ